MKLSYTASLVRQHDPDRYLTSLFLKPDKREAAWALYAFNAELANIRDQVSEPMLAMIRLQWWREALESLYEGKLRQHPVLEALHPAIHSYDLPQSELEPLIRARELEWEEKPFSSMEKIEQYVDRTAVILQELLLRLHHTEDSPETSETAFHLGRAYGFSRLGIALSHPQEENLPEADRLRTIETLVKKINTHLEAFSQHAERLPDNIKPLLYLVEPTKNKRKRLLKIHRSGKLISVNQSSKGILATKLMIKYLSNKI